ncbi:uncharacterized protein G2W53_028876 [Senna tora]|uniref:Uncharacterized protein n=1 Tax=Senna tora TaxID=362788 RepID=A0A834T6P3_9FABA|nr:uncharacterized protein G2W53_028876 [Senna tora]
MVGVGKLKIEIGNAGVRRSKAVVVKLGMEVLVVKMKKEGYSLGVWKMEGKRERGRGRMEEWRGLVLWGLEGGERENEWEERRRKESEDRRRGCVALGWWGLGEGKRISSDGGGKENREERFTVRKGDMVQFWGGRGRENREEREKGEAALALEVSIQLWRRGGGSSYRGLGEGGEEERRRLEEEEEEEEEEREREERN